MLLVSPFSLPIPWITQHRTKPKFTLEDEPDFHDPASASSSPVSVQSPDLDFTESNTPVPLSSISDNAMMSAPRPPRRRWTLAMAMTDEGVTDEALVQALEQFRLQPRTSSSSSSVTGGAWNVDQDTWNWDLQWESNNNVVVIDEANQNNNNNNNGARTELESDKIPYTASLPSFPSLSAPSSPRTITTPWKTARQALLTCRELVRTERRYLTSLNVIIASETVTVPPPLMIHYASQLASVSNRFLASVEADPSALGVSAAFLSLEEAVEGAFVGWCGVVGGWFEGSSGTGSDPSTSSNSCRSEEDVIPVSLNALRRKMPTMTSLSDPVSPTPSFKSTFSSWRKDKDRSSINITNTNTKKPLIRDLAILPTQRVVRYVLLYRDLLALTPSTSPSRALVERALEAASRIAQKCDRAQDNSTFLINPSISPPPLPSRPSTASFIIRPRANSKIFLTRSRKSSTA